MTSKYKKALSGICGIECFYIQNIIAPMKEQSCPVCDSDSYLNPNIKIYISPCFHRLCEDCLRSIFKLGYASCPECKTPLRKINYITSTFEDNEVEREIRIRKLMDIYFKRNENEFLSVSQYDDYLEEYENMFERLYRIKNDQQIKKLVLEENSRSSILKPRSQDDPVHEEESISELISYVLEPEDAYPVIDVSLKIPEEIFCLETSGGLTKSMVLEKLVLELYMNP